MGPRVSYNQSPVPVISLHCCSFGKIAGFGIRLLILVPLPHSHLADITVASLRTPVPTQNSSPCP